jgi:hypothetical protein
MTFEELQKAWQAQPDRPRLNIDADVLLRELRRNEQGFDWMIIVRDSLEIGAAVVLAALTIYAAIYGPDSPFFISHLRWPFLLIAAAALWVAGFLIVDRRRQRNRELVTTNPLRYCIQASLRKVEHQIALLKSMFWWYLLPLGIAVAGFMGAEFWEVELMARQAAPSGPHPTPAGETGLIVIRAVGFGTLLLGIALVIVAYRWIYRLNQTAVRRKLEPRRDELQSLLSSLNLDDD